MAIKEKEIIVIKIGNSYDSSYMYNGDIKQLEYVMRHLVNIDDFYAEGGRVIYPRKHVEKHFELKLGKFKVGEVEDYDAYIEKLREEQEKDKEADAA